MGSRPVRICFLALLLLTPLHASAASPPPSQGVRPSVEHGDEEIATPLAPAPSAGWTYSHEIVPNPWLFGLGYVYVLGNRALALDPKGRPHIGVMAGEHFPFPYLNPVHLTKIGSAWSASVIADRRIAGSLFGVDLDAQGRFHVIAEGYLDGAGLYGREGRAGWKFDRVEYSPVGIPDISMAVTASGEPHLLHHTALDQGDRAIVHDWLDHGVWRRDTVDIRYSLWDYALALDAAGRPQAAYLHWNDEDPGGLLQIGLRVRGSTGWQPESVAVTTFNPHALELAVSADGAPNLIWIDSEHYFAVPRLRWASRVGNQWVAENVAQLDGATTRFPVIALDARGEPHIAYAERGSIFHAHRKHGRWVLETVQSGLADVQSLSIAVEERGTAHFVYLDYREAVGWTLYHSQALEPPHAGPGAAAATPATGTDAAASGERRLRVHSATGVLPVSFGMDGAGEGTYSARVLDVSGRTVRRWEGRSSGDVRDSWDGRSSSGERVPLGVYFLDLDAPGRRGSAKLVLVN